MNGLDLYDGITLHQGDCRDIMREYPDQHFDAIITDPPYGISFEGEKWDTATPHGFQAWAQSWGEEALRVIKPGGYMLAFSATRTYHRLTSGLEDAGFEIRDAMAWIRADGKPAGMDLSSAFDRAAGVLDQREGREIERWDTSNAATTMASYKTNATGQPVTDEAKTWEGWGIGLKPAWEPIAVARRPPTHDTPTPCGRQTSAIRQVRRVDDGTPRRPRHRPRPRSKPRTTTQDARQRRRPTASRARGSRTHSHS